MNSDNKPISAHGEEDNVMDGVPMNSDEKEAFDRFLIRGLEGSAAFANFAVAEPEADFTEEDPKTTDSPCTSEEFIGGILSRMEETHAMSSADEESRLEDSPSRGAHVVAKETGQTSEKLGALMDQYYACQQVEEWRWSSEFRKSQHEIGRGGQGVVYSIESVDPFFANRALKVLSPAPYDDAESYRQDMERMKSVASTVEQICHGNLIQVDRFNSHEGSYYMVMRRIDGFDLQYLRQPEIVERLLESVSEEHLADLKNVVFAPWKKTELRALKPGVAVNIIENCLRGLSALHDKNIVHCDIKPSNIMLSEDGNIRIIDIGSAHKLGSRPKHCWWTARYTPPEVLEGGDWTPQGDLASLGYMLIEMLSGRPDVLTELPGGSPDSIGPSTGSDSVSKLYEPTRLVFAAAKRQLPDRLEEFALHSNRLKLLCKKLIHSNPTKRFPDARTAIFGEDGTHRFLRELVNANLDSHWFGVMESWIKDMKDSVPAAADCGQ